MRQIIRYFGASSAESRRPDALRPGGEQLSPCHVQVGERERGVCTGRIYSLPGRGTEPWRSPRAASPRGRHAPHELEHGSASC